MDTHTMQTLDIELPCPECQPEFPDINCHICGGHGKTAHTIDPARAIAVLFQYVAFHESKICDGYPRARALRDLLDACQPETNQPE